MGKFIIGIVALLSLSVPIFAADTPVADVPVAAGSIVPGLELPADQSVDYNEGFVNIKAKCKGDVKWLVISPNAKVKYIPLSQSIVVAVPPVNGQVIDVYAVGLVDGKVTDFAHTAISVTGGPTPCPTPGPTPPPGPGPTPNPGPNPTPAPVAGRLHVTFVVDMSSTTPALAQLLNSQTLRDSINQKGHWFRLYDAKSPILAQKKLDQVLAKVGGSNAMIVQSDAGNILAAQAIPKTEIEIMSIITQLSK